MGCRCSRSPAERPIAQALRPKLCSHSRSGGTWPANGVARASGSVKMCNTARVDVLPATTRRRLDAARKRTGRGAAESRALDELDFLASVEHSLCVEYLSVHCALGHDQDPAGAGTTAQRVADAAQAAAAMAQDEMRHLHDVNRALVDAGRPPQLARALSIPRTSGSDVAFGPLNLEQLDRLIERERELASAVDERYARLRPAIAPPNPVFEGELSKTDQRSRPAADHPPLARRPGDEIGGNPTERVPSCDPSGPQRRAREDLARA